MQSTIEPADIVEQTRVPEVVARLLNEAKAIAGERRAEARHPFFRPVTITVEDKGGILRSFSAFATDISATGIGLLHNMALEVGEAIVTIKDGLGDSVRLRGEITWCQPCGEGWYLSGSRFLGLE